MKDAISITLTDPRDEDWTLLISMDVDTEVPDGTLITFSHTVEDAICTLAQTLQSSLNGLWITLEKQDMTG